MKLINNKIVCRLIIVLCIAFCSGCVLLTDAATRLAFDIRDGALELEASDLNKLEIEHKPMKWPAGVSGDYSVLIKPLTLIQDPVALSVSVNRGLPIIEGLYVYLRLFA